MGASVVVILASDSRVWEGKGGGLGALPSSWSPLVAPCAPLTCACAGADVDADAAGRHVLLRLA